MNNQFRTIQITRPSSRKALTSTKSLDSMATLETRPTSWMVLALATNMDIILDSEVLTRDLAALATNRDIIPDLKDLTRELATSERTMVDLAASEKTTISAALKLKITTITPVLILVVSVVAMALTLILEASVGTTL